MIVDVDIRSARYYDELNPEEHTIAFKELEAEERDMEAGSSAFLFVDISPGKLPPSFFESPDMYVPASYPNILREKIIEEHRAKIHALEASIQKKGYERNCPVMLFAVPARDMNQPSKSIACLEGGMHRLQAVRNLIGKGIISPAFKLPCLIRFHCAEKAVSDMEHGTFAISAHHL